MRATFERNDCITCDGGAIGNRGDLTAIESRFVGNLGDDAGAIRHSEGRARLIGTLFQANGVSDSAGALLIDENSTMSLVRCQVRNNDAGAVGAIFNGGSLTISETTILDNVARGGSPGAIYNSGDLVIRSSFIARNRAHLAGGAIEAVSGSTTRLERTIVTANEGDPVGGIFYNPQDALFTVRSSVILGNRSVPADPGWDDCSAPVTVLAPSLLGLICR